MDELAFLIADKMGSRPASGSMISCSAANAELKKKNKKSKANFFIRMFKYSFAKKPSSREARHCEERFLRRSNLLNKAQTFQEIASSQIALLAMTFFKESLVLQTHAPTYRYQYILVRHLWEHHVRCG